MTRKRTILVGALLVIALSGAYLVAVLGALRNSTMPISYWVVDDRTLGVQVMSGAGYTCGIDATEETTTEVRVRVDCRGPLLSAGSSAVGILHDFVVPLRAPLADRAVLNGSGLPAKRCATPSCWPGTARSAAGPGDAPIAG